MTVSKISNIMFEPIQRDQLVKAAKNGRADDIFALMAEGANIEYKDQVRFSYLFEMLIGSLIA